MHRFVGLCPVPIPISRKRRHKRGVTFFDLKNKIKHRSVPKYLPVCSLSLGPSYNAFSTKNWHTIVILLHRELCLLTGISSTAEHLTNVGLWRRVREM